MTVRNLRFSLAALLCTAPMTGAIPLVAQSAAAQSSSARTAFDPEKFFQGATVSRGTLKEILSSEKATHAENFGTLRSDGTLVLEQDVKIGDDPVKHRVWHLRETSPGKFTGTISDAKGPVKGKVTGNAMSLSYTLEGNLSVDQVITLQPGGRSASNAMKIKKFGVVVARLKETIARK